MKCAAPISPVRLSRRLALRAVFALASMPGASIAAGAHGRLRPALVMPRDFARPCAPPPALRRVCPRALAHPPPASAAPWQALCGASGALLNLCPPRSARLARSRAGSAVNFAAKRRFHARLSV
jgi:hypothetical protein